MILIYTHTMVGRRSALLALVVLGTSLTACTTVTPPTSGVVEVVAAEAQWGSIVQAIGGSHVHVVDLIDNPTVDPHAYEPTPRDADAVAHANLVVVNGLGYDAWASQLATAAGGSIRVLDLGAALGYHLGDNPHRWYALDAVRNEVPSLIVHALDEARPGARLRRGFERGAEHFADHTFEPVAALATTIATRFAGTPIGASESIASPLALSLRLNLETPASFLRAISEGDEPTASDLATIDRQISSHRIAVYLDNTQNETPEVQAQMALCRKVGIPVVAITETPPTNRSYVAWQAGQLRALLAALEDSRGTR